MKKNLHHEVRKPSREDKLQAEITRAASKAVFDALRITTAQDPHRTIRSLQKHEIEAVAIATVTAYINARDLVEFAEDLQPLRSDISIFG